MSGTTTHWAIPYPTGTDSPPNVASDMQSGFVATDTSIYAVGNAAGITNITGTGTTTSASYASIPAVSSFSFTKASTLTRLRIDASFECFSTATNTNVVLGVLVNGVDHDIVRHTFSPANQVESFSGVLFIAAAGLAAGAYTIQMRWKRTGGAGTVSVDTTCWISVACQEVSP